MRLRALLLRMVLGMRPPAALAALCACSEHPGATPGSAEDAGAPAVDVDDASAMSLEDASASAGAGFDTGLDTTAGQPDASTSDGLVLMPDEAGAADAADPSATTRASLVRPESWLPVGAAEDPFEDRPEVVECPAYAWMAESLSGERVFSVDTGGCHYLSVTQSTLREVAAGETIKIRLWHFELSASEPAEAHAAVLVNGLRVLEERVTIPRAGGLISRQLRVERAVPVGAPVHFHLHNHGANSWSLVELSAGP